MQQNPSVIIDFDDDDGEALDELEACEEDERPLAAGSAAAGGSLMRVEDTIERLRQQIQAAERPAEASGKSRIDCTVHACNNCRLVLRRWRCIQAAHM